MTSSTNEELQAEAGRILQSGLASLLARYGDVHVVGSYALGLMTWRDLDIHLVPEKFGLQDFFRLGGELAELLRPHRMHFRDETSVATPGLPQGLYWGVYLGDERDGAWKIDVWSTNREGLARTLHYGQEIARRLGSNERDAILQIKAACWRHPEYRRAFTSTDVYAAVLDRGVRDTAGFWTDLERTRGFRGQGSY